MNRSSRNPPLDISALALAASFAWALAVWPPLARAQNVRDFVFTNTEGHLVLRFAGIGPSGLNATQMDEITSVELATMVHDRLRADSVFEAEPVNRVWADSMQARIADHVGETSPEFSARSIECRSESCRLVLQHASTRRVTEHQSLMGVAQHVIEAFVDTHPESFEPVFLIAAHYQEPEQPYTKVFLYRAAEPRFTF